MRNVIVRWRQVIFAFALAALAATPLCGQSDPCLHRTVPVNVLTAKGETVTGLTPENFKASFHRKPVKIVSVTEDKGPRRVLIVLDSSGSMIAHRREWQVYVGVARDLTRLLPPDGSIGLVVFTSKIEKYIPLTRDRAEIQKELAWLQAGTEKFEGKTSLWDTVSVASSEFDAPQEGDAIYAITDGGDNTSKTRLNQLREILSEKRIRLFMFSKQTLPDEDISTEHVGLMNIQDLADSTGGHAVRIHPNAQEDVPKLTDKSGKATPEGALVLRQFGEIFTFNRVEIELPERFEKSQEWSLDTKGLTAHDLLLTYPRRLAGCGTAPAAAVAKH
jgi:Mg-chelatase subunit ChlD